MTVALSSAPPSIVASAPCAVALSAAASAGAACRRSRGERIDPYQAPIKGRKNIPVSGTNRRRGERILPAAAPPAASFRLGLAPPPTPGRPPAWRTTVPSARGPARGDVRARTRGCPSRLPPAPEAGGREGVGSGSGGDLSVKSRRPRASESD
eukprot:1195864-Prorocentrum_minimum.AAC.4